MMQITTHSADETQALGQKLASRLAPGDVIAYFGDLGAGKTAFTRGLAQGLGINHTRPRRGKKTKRTPPSAHKQNT